MHGRLQFGMRENPASDRRHGSRFAVPVRADESCIGEKNCTSSPSLDSEAQSPITPHSFPHAASPHAATGAREEGVGRIPAPSLRRATSQRPVNAFEPLISSFEAAKLLGDIHVKTLQRYARNGALPGYRIGGHWYFRASDLDSWLRSRI